MAANLGSSSALFRVGSGEPSKVYLGSVAVQDVPGAPTMIECCSDINSLVVFYPPTTGGSPILEYEIWVDQGPLTEFVQGPVLTGPVNDPNSPPGSLTITVEGENFAGLDVSLRARNAIGWGPLAADVVAQVC
ncbi:MAG: hypothetical protein VKK63_08390 [Synechococcus sp.]|nr:hypothetical protein [Synechococcus sp.]